MTERPVVTPEEVLDRVAAAGGHLLLTDLDADELAAWRHAARVAQLRLWRTGSARLCKWTFGTSLRITAVAPHPLVVEMREGMARRDADRWRPYGHRGYVPDWIPDVPRQKSGRIVRGHEKVPACGQV